MTDKQVHSDDQHQQDMQENSPVSEGGALPASSYRVAPLYNNLYIRDKPGGRVIGSATRGETFAITDIQYVDGSPWAALEGGGYCQGIYIMKVED